MSKQKISAEAQAILSAADAGLHLTTIGLVEKFVETNPRSIRAWLDLGQALGQLARYEPAEQAFQKAIELSGDQSNGAILGEIGNLYRARGDFETAIVWYQKQIDAEPDDAMGYLYLGNIQMRRGNFAAAKAAFESALTCDRVCLEEAHYSMGLVNRCTGLISDAKTHFEKAIELDPKFTQAKIALKDVMSATG